MKIWVIHPKDEILKYNRFIDFQKDSKNIGKYGILNEFSTYEPEFLLLGSYLKKAGNEVRYIDENLGDTIPSGEIPDIFISGGVTCQAERFYELSREFSKLGSKTILVGQHVSINSQEAARNADLVVKGNPSGSGEIILENLNNSGIINGGYSCDFITDFSLLSIKPKIFPIVASRGCKRGCLFCTVNSGGHHNMLRKPDTIDNELKSLKKYVNSPQIVFMDDNFFMNLDWLDEILEVLEGLNIRYGTHGDISGGGNRKIVEKLKKSGCYRIFLGLESLEERVLERYAPVKRNLLEHYEEYVKNFQKNGISTLLSFIVGFDEEKNIIEKIISFIERVNPAAISISLLTPMPGTPIYEQYESAGRIVERDYSKYTQNYPIIDFKGKEEYLIDGIKKIYKLFYSDGQIKKRVELLKRMVEDG